MRKLLRIMLLLSMVVVIGLSIITGVTFAKPSNPPSNPKPLSISFASPLPQNAYDQIDYSAKIAWTNPNSDLSYRGSLLFTVSSKSGTINTADITLSYKGLTVNPQKSSNTLLFYIPQQTFEAGKSGNFIVTVTYKTVGSYNWEIGVVK